MKKIFLLVFYLFCLTQNVYAANLLTNPDFEDTDDTAWKKNTSSITYTNTDEDHYQGAKSAKITNTKTSSFGIEQIILDISSSLNYKISTFAKPILPTDKVFLRVAWYKSSDASGSQLSTDDSEFTKEANWQKLEISKTPPDGVLSAKLRLLVASGSAYFDSVNFEESFSPTTTPSATPQPSQIPQISPTLTITPNPTPTPISFNDIFISEVMIDPPTDENEWIELYNNNDFDVDLANWFIDDLEDAGSNPKSFSLNIKTHSYASIDLTSSIFNNDSDSIRLLDFNKNQKDILIYSKSEKGKSLARNDQANSSFCIQEPTKNQPNNICTIPTIASSPTPSMSMSKSVSQSINLDPSIAPTNTVTPIIDLNNYSNDSEVLGEKTSGQNASKKSSLVKNDNLVKFLSSLSFSYSLLTILSIFFKMKINV